MAIQHNAQDVVADLKIDGDKTMTIISVPITEVKGELEIIVNEHGRRAAQKTIKNVLEFGKVNALCQQWFSSLETK